MMQHLKRYWLAGIIVVAILALAPFQPAIAAKAATNTGSFLLNVLAILPSVMLLMGLFDVWVPRPLVEKRVGPGSGVSGVALSILLGTAAAGPLYAAFPVAVSLRKKGARIANIAIFLGTWATIKIPMILLESNFMGLRFAMLRLVLTVPAVISAGYVMELLVPASTLSGSLAAADSDS